MANQERQEELEAVENNVEELEWTKVEQDSFTFWDDIGAGSEIIGVYVDDYTRKKIVDDKVVRTESPILDTRHGKVVLPEHKILLDYFNKIDHGKLVRVLCTDKEMANGKPKLYHYEVYTLLNGGGLKSVK